MASGRAQLEKKVLNETVHTCNRGVQEDQGCVMQTMAHHYRQNGNCEVEEETLGPEQTLGRHLSQSEVRENTDAQRRKHRRQGSSKTLDYGDQKLSIDKENKSLENITDHTEQLTEGRRHKSTGHQSNKMQTKESNKKQIVTKQSPYGSLTRQSLRTRGERASEQPKFQDTQENVRDGIIALYPTHFIR